MSRFDDYFSEGAKKLTTRNKPDPIIHTGAYERVTIQGEDSYELAIYLKGTKVIGVTFANQTLPFTTHQASSEQIATFAATYKKGLAGLIDRLVVRVAKRS